PGGRRSDALDDPQQRARASAAGGWHAVRGMRMLLACAVLSAQAFSVQAADAVRGQQLYESRCGACHSIDENRAGPAHKGVYGRKAGLAKGFDYSSAVKASKIIWNATFFFNEPATTEKLIPGQKMGFS